MCFSVATDRCDLNLYSICITVADSIRIAFDAAYSEFIQGGACLHFEFLSSLALITFIRTAAAQGSISSSTFVRELAALVVVLISYRYRASLTKSLICCDTFLHCCRAWMIGWQLQRAGTTAESRRLIALAHCYKSERELQRMPKRYSACGIAAAAAAVDVKHGKHVLRFINFKTSCVVYQANQVLACILCTRLLL
jgi:hypothetical protein